MLVTCGLDLVQMLHIIGVIGTAGGTGYVIEFAGEAIEALSVEVGTCCLPFLRRHILVHMMSLITCVHLCIVSMSLHICTSHPQPTFLDFFWVRMTLPT